MAFGRWISPEERERIVGLAATGLGFKIIAAECGISTATAQRIAAKAGQRRRLATKNTTARNAQPDSPRDSDDDDSTPYEVKVDAYLAAVADERLAVNGGRTKARERVLAALDRMMGRRS